MPANQYLNSDATFGGGSVIKDFQLNTSVSDKLNETYGRSISMYIWSTVAGNNTYYWNRNNQFRSNRLYANGKIDMTRFMDRLQMNGKQNYANVNWSCIKICNTIVGRLVGGWMRRSEKINVTAVDPISVKSRNEQAEQAEFVFDNKEVLLSLQQESGVPLIPQDQFVAEDKDELEQWVSEFNRVPEEIKYELGCNNILQANGWFDVLKSKMLHDSAEVGLVGTYTYMNNEGEIIVEWLRPENLIYSFSEHSDFRDTTYRGVMKSLKISDLRRRYGAEFGGKLTEEEIWQLAQTAKEYQMIDKIRWMQEWNVSLLRPYDEWNIDILEFELKSLDEEGFTVKTTKNGSTLITKGVLDKLKENQRIVKRKSWNIYRGVYAITAQKMLEWGIKDNMIRPQDPKESGNAEFSYSFYMYQNFDMRNVAVPEKIQEPLDQMIIARLKIQQLVSKMTPAGAAIDVDSLQELDLGLGDLTSPLETQKIWEQTGRLYYRGRDAEGNKIPAPITEMANAGFVPQLRGLMELYQYHYQVLKDELGLDPNLNSSIAAPRVTTQNAESAIIITDNTTDYMYDAYLHCMEDTAKKVACLLNTSVTHGAKKYREILKQDNVIGRNFSTKVKMLPSEQQVAKLEGMLNVMMESNPDFVLYLDPFKLIRVAKEDIKLAELLFRQAQKRYIKGKQKQAEENSKYNSDIQVKSQQAKSESDAAIEKQKEDAKNKQILLTGYFDLLKSNVVPPTDMQQVLSEVVKSVAIPLALENQQTQMKIQQAYEQEIQEVDEQSEMNQEAIMQEQKM